MAKYKHDSLKECKLLFNKICRCPTVPAAEVRTFVCCGAYHWEAKCRGRVVYSRKIVEEK